MTESAEATRTSPGDKSAEASIYNTIAGVRRALPMAKSIVLKIEDLKGKNIVPELERTKAHILARSVVEHLEMLIDEIEHNQKKENKNG